MDRSTIRFKTLTVLFLIGLVTLAAGGAMVWFVNQIKAETDVVVALERQRMLTQTMAKAALGYVMARSGYQTMAERVRFLDAYITETRRVYIDVIHFPSSGTNAPSLPAPTAFTRMVNEAFGKRFDLSLDILAETPLNPRWSLRDRTDWQALAWLKANPEKIYGTTNRETRGAFLRFYTADLATEQRCITCHASLSGRSLSPGNILGIRRYLFRFSEDVALGKAELEPSLGEYYHARDLFQNTLHAIRFGAPLPQAQPPPSGEAITPVTDPAAHSKISAIQSQFTRFTETVQSLFKAEQGSAAYRKARQELPSQANRLRSLSDDLVRIQTQAVHARQTWEVALVAATTSGVVLLLILSAAIFLKEEPQQDDKTK